MAIFLWRRLRAISLVVPLLFTSPALLAQGEARIRTEPVHFTDSSRIKVIDGTIIGDEQIDYVLRPLKGQNLSVSLATHHASTYFKVLSPGGEVPLFDGAEQGSQYDGIIPETGMYKVRVYMTGSDVQREEQASYQLEMVLMDAPKSADSEQYDAMGKVPCAQRIGQPEMQCNFGVIRTGAGAAEVLLILPDQSRRIIFFEGGRATGSDASQTSSAGRFRVERNGDVNTILVGEERYEIPDSVVSGR